jgi:hypothetical protein
VTLAVKVLVELGTAAKTWHRWKQQRQQQQQHALSKKGNVDGREALKKLNSNRTSLLPCATAGAVALLLLSAWLGTAAKSRPNQNEFSGNSSSGSSGNNSSMQCVGVGDS